MVPPNGVSLARSGSTWIHWWSPVASAKASMSFWETPCQSETPSSSPSAALSSSNPVIVRMAGNCMPAQPPEASCPARAGRRWWRATAADGRLGGDVMDASNLHQATPDAERRFRTLVERLPAVVYEAEPGVKRRWRYVSPYVRALLGYSAEELMAAPGLWTSRLHEDDREAVLASEQRLAAGERVTMEYRLLARDGSVVWVRDDSVPRREPDGAVVLDGLLTDVTDRKAAEARLQHLADHDVLTGLLNRRRFAEELESEIAATRRGMRSSDAVVLDVDGFKYVNDSLGHQAGDELIRSVARRLAGRLRASDTVARLCGGEFTRLARGGGAGPAGRG